ncbi:MAG: hypothetical protein FWG90_10315 [Oscillospiraceae bacterium]|nr:hypothetical protein [Oscillospiraceae bacterium]
MEMKNNMVLTITISGLLIAAGIAIPMFMPLKVMIPPASFTLASHVPIFLAMFISPFSAAMVAVGTTVGFAVGGFPPVIVFRAATHILFATLGAFYLKKRPDIHSSPVELRVFSFSMALLHALGELLAVGVFYFGGNMSELYYQQGFLTSGILLVGLGTLIHSMVDFEIANVVKRAVFIYKK